MSYPLTPEQLEAEWPLTRRVRDYVDALGGEHRFLSNQDGRRIHWVRIGRRVWGGWQYDVSGPAEPLLEDMATMRLSRWTGRLIWDDPLEGHKR